MNTKLDDLEVTLGKDSVHMSEVVLYLLLSLHVSRQEAYFKRMSMESSQKQVHLYLMILRLHPSC